MKLRILSAICLGAVALFCAGSAKADAVQTTAKVNGDPLLCGPIQKALFIGTAYLEYNPETAKPVMEMPRTELMTSGYVHPAPWWPDPLQWGGFKQDNPTIFSALLDAGELYDRTYIVYSVSLDFYGEQHPRPVYRLTHLRSAKLPEIFEQDDGSALTEGLKTLKASDLVVYGARAYPIVRKPGEIIVYEIDTDQPGKQTFEQKKFIPNIICDFTDGAGGDAAATSGAAAAAPTASQIPAVAVPVPPAAVVPAVAPAAAVAPSAPPPDACAPYQASNPGYFASCEDRLQKMQRLNSLNAQP